MLLGTRDASLLGNVLAGKGVNRAREGIARAGYGSSIKNKDSQNRLILWLILKYKSTIRMSLDLMEFVLEIIYQIK